MISAHACLVILVYLIFFFSVEVFFAGCYFVFIFFYFSHNQALGVLPQPVSGLGRGACRLMRLSQGSAGVKSVSCRMSSCVGLPLHSSPLLRFFLFRNRSLVDGVKPLPHSHLHCSRSNGTSKSSHPSFDVSLLGGSVPLKLFQIKDALVRDLLCRFLTNLWGSRTTLCFFRNTQRSLSVQESVFIRVQQHRVFCLSPAPIHTPRQREKYPWSNVFLFIYLSVKYRDPSLFIAWLQNRLRTMSMFAFLRYFRILGLVLRFTISNLFGEFALKGFSFYLVGKISVAGNAMSRSYSAFAGKRSASSLNLRLASNFALIRTPTGCLGFTLSYFF